MVGSVYKYVHCDECIEIFHNHFDYGIHICEHIFHPFKYMAYIKISTFGMMFKNKFEKGVSNFELKVEAFKVI